jgi:hypothetical protein
VRVARGPRGGSSPIPPARSRGEHGRHGGRAAAQDATAPTRRPRLRRAAVILVGVVFVSLVAVAAAGLVVWAGARTDTRGDVAFDRPSRSPRSRARASTPRAGASSTCACDPDARAARGHPHADLGAQRRPPGADAARAPRRARRGERAQRALRADLDALARDAPAGAHGRRSAPAHRARADLVADLGDRPARRLALVPPPPRRHHGRQVNRGLSGMFLLDDERSWALRLPHEYGVDDIR